MLIEYNSLAGKLIILNRIKNSKNEKEKMFIKQTNQYATDGSKIITNYKEMLNALPVEVFLKTVKIKENKK